MYDISIIEKTNLLTSEQSQKLLEIKEDVIHGFETIETRRSKYLMEVSVLNNDKLPTPDAQYWQAILERDIQFSNLVMESFDYQEKQADIEITNAERDEMLKEGTSVACAKARKAMIQINRMSVELKMMERNGKSRYNEIVNWTDLITKLRAKLKYSPDDQNQHMPESFLLKCAAQKKMLQEIGASDMNGAMNILSLGKNALRYINENSK